MADPTSPPREPRNLTRVAVTVVIAALWVGLWADLSWANVLAGLAVGALCTLLGEQTGRRSRYRISPLGCLRYAGHFLGALVASTWSVAVIVLGRHLDLHPAVIAVDVGHTDEYALAIVANSVTLTPGTITLAVDQPAGVLYIHCLTLRDADDEAAVVADVHRFRDLALAAIHPRQLPTASGPGPDQTAPPVETS